jgi:hypothetical protein
MNEKKKKKKRIEEGRKKKKKKKKINEKELRIKNLSGFLKTTN